MTTRLQRSSVVLWLAWHILSASALTFDWPPPKIRGTNLGGWFIAENWMNNDIFTPPNVPLDVTIPDEWHLCEYLGREQCTNVLEKHWQTWITDDDIQQIANLGLNTVRVPVPYWMVDISNGEPYVQGQYPYLQQLVRWCDQADVAVIIDMHGAPGSQNGQDNSGLLGPIRWQQNQTNIDRTLAVIRNLTAEFTKTSYNGAVVAIQLLNEPIVTLADDAVNSGPLIPITTLGAFYTEGYNIVRNSSSAGYTVGGRGTAAGTSPWVLLHDAFQSLDYWDPFFVGQNGGPVNAVRLAIDTHQYQAFNAAVNFTQAQHLDYPCTLANPIAVSQTKRLTIVGEFALGTTTICVDYHTCAGLTMADNTDASQPARDFNRKFFEVQTDAFEQGGGWIFWTWKTTSAPLWSYSTGVQLNWIPTDPTERYYAYNKTLTSGCLGSLIQADTFSELPASFTRTASGQVITATALSGSPQMAMTVALSGATSSSSPLTVNLDGSARGRAETSMVTILLGPALCLIMILLTSTVTY